MVDSASLICSLSAFAFVNDSIDITNARKMEIATPEVKISVDPKYSYLVEARVIDGKKYILISADAGVELNGVSVEIRD